MQSSQKIFRILVFGRRKSGKSALLNRLSATTFFEEAAPFEEEEPSECHNLISTQTHLFGNSQNPWCEFLEVPGMIESGELDEKVLIILAEVFKKLSEGVNLLIFTIPITEQQMNTPSQTCLKRIINLVGKKTIHGQLQIAFTSLNTLTPDQISDYKRTAPANIFKQLEEFKLFYSVASAHNCWFFNWDEKVHGLEQLVSTEIWKSYPSYNQVQQKSLETHLLSFRSLGTWRFEAIRCRYFLALHKESEMDVGPNPLQRLYLTEHSRKIILGYLDGELRIYDYDSGALDTTRVSSHGCIHSIAASDEEIYCGCDDGTIVIWRLQVENGFWEEQTELTGHQEKVLALSLSAKEGFLASGSRENAIKLWDVELGRNISKEERQ